MNAAFDDYFRRPRRAGVLAHPDATGRAGDISEGRLLYLQLDVDASGTIADSAFQAYGCAATIACAAWVAEHVVVKTSAETATLNSATMAAALALPALKIRCAVLAEQALSAALNDLNERRL